MRDGHKRRMSRKDLMNALAARPPKEWQGTSFDTETYQGWARIIATPNEWVELPRGSWRKAFRFLVDNGPRLTAFNMRFDAEAILKHLPQREMRALLAAESLYLERWSVRIVPWKMMRITDEDTGQYVEVYDIAQFFEAGLDQVARTFLGESKSHQRQGVDPARLNTDESAWSDLANIIRYCQHDAWLTERATHVIADKYNRLGGSFETPYSVAYVTADILMRDVEVPQLHPDMMALADAAFRGGWFDCVQRGRFHDGHAYDIKSAYPSRMRLLEDAHKGRWVESRRPHKDALHAIVEVVAEIPRDDYPILAPIPYKQGANKPVIYPVGTFTTLVLKETYERFEHLLTPLRSYSFIPTGDIIRPYARTLDKLLAFRQDEDQLLSDSAKRGGNSIYGKTRSRHEIKELHLIDPAETDHITDEVVHTREGAYAVRATERRGTLYNSLHAGLVTEGCRLQIWDAISRYPDRVIAIMTDGFLFDGPLPGYGKQQAEQVGDLGYVTNADTVSCGSGEYEIRGHAVATRGFFTRRPGRNSSLKSWFGALRGVRDETVRITNVRPAHLSECLSGTTRYLAADGTDRLLRHKDANVFVTFERNINVCRDDKREWPEIREARKLLKERFRGIPIEVYE